MDTSMRKTIAGVAVAAAVTAGSFIAANPFPEHVTAPENNTFKVGVANFEYEVKDDIAADNSITYRLEDKYFSMTPVSVGWNVTQEKIDATATPRKSDKAHYEGVFDGKGNIDVSAGDRILNKVVSFATLEELGEIPEGAEYLEVKFKVDTNMVIDGWNKKDDFVIEPGTKIRLGDYSYIDAPQVWDSSREEIIVVDDQCANPDYNGGGPCETHTGTDIVENRVKIETVFSSESGELYFTKRIPVAWITAAQFPIHTDADITYGTPQEFEATDVSPALRDILVEIGKLDTDKFFVCYLENTDDLSCRAATVSGTTITYGTEFLFNNDTIEDFSACAIDTNRFAVIYSDDAQADDGFTDVGIVSGTTIASSTRVEYENSDAEEPSCAGISTNKYIIAYMDETGGDDYEATACSSSGSTISCGSSVEFETSESVGPDVEVGKADTDKFLIAYSDTSTNRDFSLATGTVSTLTITMSAEFKPNDGGDNDGEQVLGYDVANIGTNLVGVIWRHVSETSDTVTEMRSFLCDLSSTISCGTAVSIERTDTSSNRKAGMAGIDSSHLVWALSSTTAANSFYNTFSGTTITKGNAEVYSATANEGPQVELISTDKIVICYVDEADATDHGECIIGDIGAAPPAATPYETSVSQVILIGF